MSWFRRLLFRGRQWRHSWALALVLALTLFPALEALAFFSGSGSGAVVGVAGATSTGVVTIVKNGPFVYAGPSTTNLALGGTVTFPIGISCTSGCPTQINSVALSGWTSDKAGCTTAALPGQFTMPTIPVNASIPTTGFQPATSAVVTYVNLGVDQTACSGASFTFTLTAS